MTSTAPTGYVPTARLRWVDRPASDVYREMVLQQWWAPNVPSFMIDENIGEWKDVPMERS